MKSIFFYLLHFILCSYYISFGFNVIVSSSPVESVIYMILCFLTASISLFLWGVDVFGIVFIIIYVGAIAVLFLFVIMMLDVKVTMPKSILSVQFYGFFRFGDFWYMGFLLLFLFFLDFQLKQDSGTLQRLPEMSDTFFMFDSFSFVDVLGQTLYNDMLYCFLIAGILLIVALVGAVVLTLHSKSIAGAQNVNRQLSRKDNFSSFFK